MNLACRALALLGVLLLTGCTGSADKPSHPSHSPLPTHTAHSGSPAPV